jgi:hypothetical protein
MRVGTRTAILIAGMLASVAAGATPAAACERRLAVELTPDVPDPRDTGFLSSLLSNQVGYRLVFLGAMDDTNIDLELRGPGPAYRCQEAIETLGRDARVVSVHASRWNTNFLQ